MTEIERIRDELNHKGSYEQVVTLAFRLNAPVCAACLAEFIESALNAYVPAEPWDSTIVGLLLSVPDGSLVAPHHQVTPEGGALQ